MKRMNTVFDTSVILAALESLRRVSAGYFRNSALCKVIKKEERLIKGHKKINLEIFIFTTLLIFILYRLMIHGR